VDAPAPPAPTPPDAEPALPPDPDRRLEHTALAAWIANGVILTIATVVALAAGIPVLDEVDGLPGWVHPLLIVAGVVIGVTSIVVRPAVLSRTWRYAVREDEIDLRRGWLVRTRTIIPMVRVQHVDTMQSGTGALLEVQTLRIHTAAGEHTIPHLETTVADHLRTTIAARAHVPDEL
jgi:membrane protein YdbS with pleckstrin-like domain